MLSYNRNEIKNSSYGKRELNMSNNIKGKVVVITGASSRLGEGDS